jgi:hypothetical protein
MQARHPSLSAVLIRNEGHTPLLLDRFSQRLISDFLVETDGSWNAAPASPVPLHKEVNRV